MKIALANFCSEITSEKLVACTAAGSLLVAMISFVAMKYFSRGPDPQQIRNKLDRQVAEIERTGVKIGGLAVDSPVQSIIDVDNETDSQRLQCNKAKKEVENLETSAKCAKAFILFSSIACLSIGYGIIRWEWTPLTDS